MCPGLEPKGMLIIYRMFNCVLSYSKLCSCYYEEANATYIKLKLQGCDFIISKTASLKLS
jgi:hypothetical protein